MVVEHRLAEKEDDNGSTFPRVLSAMPCIHTDLGDSREARLILLLPHGTYSVQYLFTAHPPPANAPANLNSTLYSH